MLTCNVVLKIVIKQHLLWSGQTKLTLEATSTLYCSSFETALQLIDAMRLYCSLFETALQLIDAMRLYCSSFETALQLIDAMSLIASINCSVVSNELQYSV